MRREVRYPTMTKRYSRLWNSASSASSPVSTRRTGVEASFPGVPTTRTFRVPILRRTAGLTWRGPRPQEERGVRLRRQELPDVLRELREDVRLGDLRDHELPGLDEMRLDEGLRGPEEADPPLPPP